MNNETRMTTWCLYRFKTRRMACDLGIDEISYAAR